ncbi:MAG TPA: LytTR family DNA-binding domain-containing protein [Cytophagaceae bacterium]
MDIMNLKCVVIDDEQPAIDVLESYINKVPYLSLVAKYNNGIDALEYVDFSAIDILFIDIQMPDINGMELLKRLDAKVNIVFTTAYPEYALKGYDFQPLDFLVKPISFDMFMRAVERAKSVNTGNSEVGEAHVEEFYIKSRGKIIRILSSDILYIEGLKDYVIFYTSDSKYIALQSMKELEEKLGKIHFIRIHKSFIVDTNKIEEVSSNQVKIGGRQIPIGRQFKPAFLKYIESKKL